jgi:WhiB family transcriptional regulator, redox-sensing transcriptional regulator
MERIPPAPLLPRAACRGKPVALFMPQRGEPTEPAKAICSACPELEPCLDYAVGIPRLPGVWGATTWRDRRLLRRSLGSREHDVNALDGVPEPDELELAEIELGTAPTNDQTVPFGLPSTNGNSNGHAPEPARLCQRCGTALSGVQARWCSTRCRKAAAPKKAQVARTSNHPTPAVARPQTAVQGEFSELAHRFFALTGADELRFQTRGLSAVIRRESR